MLDGYETSFPRGRSTFIFQESYIEEFAFTSAWVPRRRSGQWSDPAATSVKAWEIEAPPATYWLNHWPFVDAVNNIVGNVFRFDRPDLF
jgi:hypothetical protein